MVRRHRSTKRGNLFKDRSFLTLPNLRVVTPINPIEILSRTHKSAADMNLEHLISGRDTSEVDSFINKNILPLFKEVKHLTFHKESFDDLFANYVKQIDSRYSKLISKRLFLRCLILGLQMRLTFAGTNHLFRGKMENLVQSSVVGI